MERAHKDRIMVTPSSPEALEEPYWMYFFKGLHQSGKSALLDGSTVNPEFERFYLSNIPKILMLRGGERYLSKGNYNVTRLKYLLKLFPDSRFVIPVRNPVSHIASLMKQAQEMQGRMAEMQEDLARLRVEGSAGGGMVTVEANGQQKILAVRVEQSLLESDDREMLEDLLVAATNQALEKAREAAGQEMSKLTGEINIPGLNEALSKICNPTA